MAGIHVMRVELTVVLTVPEQLLEQHLAASPAVVGHELACQIAQYSQQEKLGYFPPLHHGGASLAAGYPFRCAAKAGAGPSASGNTLIFGMKCPL